MAYILTVTIKPAGVGGILISPIGTYVGPGKVSFPAGTLLTMTAQCFISGGYFDHWEGALSGSANPTNLVMNSDKAVTAVFVIPPTGLTHLTTGVIGNGSIAPSSGTYNIGDQIILVATPGPGYVFDSWSGDIDGTTPVPGMPNCLTVVMDKDRHIVAKFVTAPPGISEFKILNFLKV